MIMEMQGSDKYTPNFTVNHIEEDGHQKIQYVFEVPEETSAKDIEIDVKEDEIRLNSANYEFSKKFKDFMLDDESIRAKFSKKAKTLTLTVDKIECIN